MRDTPEDKRFAFEVLGINGVLDDQTGEITLDDQKVGEIKGWSLELQDSVVIHKIFYAPNNPKEYLKENYPTGKKTLVSPLSYK